MTQRTSTRLFEVSRPLTNQSWMAFWMPTRTTTEPFISVKGRAGDIIPDLAESLEVDLVVIGTVGRGGVPGLLIGNTAETILNAVDCSVLTLKPEGFETPIQV